MVTATLDRMSKRPPKQPSTADRHKKRWSVQLPLSHRSLSVEVAAQFERDHGVRVELTEVVVAALNEYFRARGFEPPARE